MPSMQRCPDGLLGYSKYDMTGMDCQTINERMLSCLILWIHYNYILLRITDLVLGFMVRGSQNYSVEA